MPPSKNLATYSDVFNTLESAVKHGEIIYVADTPGKAKNFCMRINTFLKLLREHTASQQGVVFAPTHYDDLSHSVSEHEPCQVTIKTRAPLSKKLTNAQGTPIEDAAKGMERLLNGTKSAQGGKDEPEPDYAQFASNFARQQGITDD